MSEQQSAALRDGRVTFQEYEAGVLAAVRCLADAGLAPTTPELRSGGRLYAFTFAVPVGQDDLLQRADACLAAHLQGVQAAWTFANQPTGQELAQARMLFLQCLRDAGIGVPEVPDARYFLGIGTLPAFEQCRARVQEDLGLISYDP